MEFTEVEISTLKEVINFLADKLPKSTDKAFPSLILEVFADRSGVLIFDKDLSDNPDVLFKFVSLP